MKYWTISFPGEHGQHVQETWNEEQIMSSYLPYWTSKMLEHFGGPHESITKENCLQDWITVHWASETDEFGRILKNE